MGATISCGEWRQRRSTEDSHQQGWQVLGTGSARGGGERKGDRIAAAAPDASFRASAHLATITLAELPDVPGRDLLSADTRLAFFADLSNAGEFWKPVESGDPGRE